LFGLRARREGLTPCVLSWPHSSRVMKVDPDSPRRGHAVAQACLRVLVVIPASAARYQR